MPGRRRQKRTDRSKLDATPPWEQRVREEPEPTHGPYDERDAPADKIPRIDLGALRIPIGDAYKITVQVDESQQVISAILEGADGTMQLGVFAAPRNEGVWDEIRPEIAESINGGRKSATHDEDGEFGVELHGTVRADGGTVAVRFLGIDGPRWFLRAAFAGPVATDPAKAKVFEDALRDVIVVRGSAPLPSKDPVPLQLPSGFELPDDVGP